MMKPLKILYQDEDVIVADKPSGILSIPDRKNNVSIKELLLNHTDAIYPVHRLDFETSGAICFAKNKKAHQDLNFQFQDRKIRKKYQAIVIGKPSAPEGEINLPIDTSSIGKVRIHAKGKESITQYRTLESFNGYSLLELNPLTGRTHQIRIHLSESGCPIVGDVRYGGRYFYLSSIKRGYKRTAREERPLMNRTALHAASLTFILPEGKKEICVESKLPKDINATLRQMRKLIPLNSPI